MTTALLKDSVGADPDRVRMLLIAYHFPPASTAGALRWEKLSRFFAERGWDLDVLTRVPAVTEQRDDRRLAALPPGVRVLAVAPEPTPLERLSSWLFTGRRLDKQARPTPRGEVGSVREESVRPEDIRWALTSPVGRSRAYTAWVLHERDWSWGRGARRAGLQFAKLRRYRAVISCGPPHYPHEAARTISQRSGIPLIVDYRDPWATRRRLPANYASPMFHAIADKHEHLVLRAAQLVTTTCEGLSDALRTRYPGLPVTTVMNGYDEEDAPPRTPWGPQFILAYAGSIYLDRDPRPVFRAARRVVDAHQLDPSRFAIEFIGTQERYGGAGLADLARSEGLEAFLRLVPRQPRAEVQRTLSRAAVLISLPQDSPFAIPSKLFEYMQFASWVLALTDPDTPIARLLAGTSADVHVPEDVDGIAQSLVRRYSQFAAGERPAPISDLGRYSRREQAGRLIAAMEPLVS